MIRFFAHCIAAISIWCGSCAMDPEKEEKDNLPHAIVQENGDQAAEIMIAMEWYRRRQSPKEWIKSIGSKILRPFIDQPPEPLEHRNFLSKKGYRMLEKLQNPNQLDAFSFDPIDVIRKVRKPDESTYQEVAQSLIPLQKALTLPEIDIPALTMIVRGAGSDFQEVTSDNETLFHILFNNYKMKKRLPVLEFLFNKLTDDQLAALIQAEDCNGNTPIHACAYLAGDTWQTNNNSDAIACLYLTLIKKLDSTVAALEQKPDAQARQLVGLIPPNDFNYITDYGSIPFDNIGRDNVARLLQNHIKNLEQYKDYKD